MVIADVTIIKLFIPAAVSFIFGILITPFLTSLMYRYRLWKRVARHDPTNLEMSESFKKLHNGHEEVKTPRVGGVVVWLSVFLSIIFLWIIAKTNPEQNALLDFISRRETWLPIAGMFVGAGIGLFEDFVEIFGKKNGDTAHGIPSKYLVTIIAFIGLLAALWFYIKLGMHIVHVPLFGALDLGVFFIPFFILVMLGTFSSRVIDGVDGLSAGVLATAFASYGVVALVHGQYDMMALCMTITGAILAFLWFNVPPARFYMGETGMLPLTIALTLVAFLTGEPFLLLIIGFPLVATALSSFIQIVSKKYFGKKVFLVAPLHHHFEALGWSRPKITMRYWIVSLMCGVLGILLALFG